MELRSALDAGHSKLPARARYRIELIFEELVGNILRYGAPQGGDLHIEVSVEIGEDCIAITIEDDGIAFDPCDPGGVATLSTSLAAPRHLSEPRDGGFGLILVRHAAHSMRYERIADRRNRLRVTLSPRQV